LNYKNTGQNWDTNQNGIIMFRNEQKINNMEQISNLNKENTIKTYTNNTSWDTNKRYNTHMRKKLTGGIVQLILSSIELFLSFSFVGSSKAIIFEDVGLFF
jgi:hypothetical protein